MPELTTHDIKFARLCNDCPDEVRRACRRVFQGRLFEAKSSGSTGCDAPVDILVTDADRRNVYPFAPKFHEVGGALENALNSL